MNCRIVSDSSSNVFSVEGADYTTVPMKVIAGDREYVDTPELDLRGMVADLKSYKGKSGSSCANVQEWLDAFRGADNIFGVTFPRTFPAATTPPSRPLRSTWRKILAKRSIFSIRFPLVPSKSCWWISSGI